MVDLSNYPFPTYIPNKIIAYIFISVIFLLFLIWFIQSIQNHFQPIRLIILLFVSHLTILSELIIRATSNIIQEHAKIGYIIMTILYTIGQRTIIIANFAYLIQFYNKKSILSRLIFLGISICIILSDILMGLATILSFESDKIQLSFLFRQISTSIICLVNILFYFVWFCTKTFSIMSYELIILLIISSLNCLIITIFLLIMSIPKYYIMFNDNEQWFYLFQILPIVLTLITWSMLHPKRSSKFRNQLTVEKEFDKIKIAYVF